MKKPALVFTTLLLAALACNLPFSAAPRPGTETPATATQTPSAAPTAQATATQPPLSQLVSLESIIHEESSQSPVYTLKTETPLLRGSNDPGVEKFNRLTAAITQEMAEGFKKDMVGYPAEPVSAGSFFQVSFQRLSPEQNPVISLLFNVDGYYDGAAHPFHAARSFNYDLETGQEITLEQLFAPGADFLTPISQYCIAQLQTRDIGFDMFSDGANPRPENYSVWNLSAEGLQIYFSEYQVAPYAAGPQTALIPYAKLAPILRIDGPIRNFLP